MPRVTQRLRVGLILVLFVILGGSPLRAAAVATAGVGVVGEPSVIITELQVANDSASQEFIELYNTTGEDIDFTDAAGGGKNVWKLQFYSSTSVTAGTPDWMRPAASVSLTGTLPAYGYYLVAGNGYAPGGVDADQSYSPRLSDAGGGLQVIQATLPTASVHDRLMWKRPVAGQSMPEGVLNSPLSGSSLQRLPNNEDTYGTDGVLLEDFAEEKTVSPKDVWRAEVVTEPSGPEEPELSNETPTDETTVPSIPTEDIDNTGLTPPYLTELLPNPASPLRDETDEFIELYNPNDTAFDLKGYTIQVGVSTLHDFTFTESLPLAPMSYVSFYSRDTGLSLTNTGGQARLLDPSGTLLGESLPYATADDGLVWAFENGIWQWSTAATPGLVNAIVPPLPPSAKAKAAVAPKTSVKKAAAKTTGGKVKGATTKKAAKPKAKKPSKPKVAAVANTSEKQPRAPIHTGILVAVAGAAVLYAAYEYRQDLSNRIYKLKQHRAVRLIARK